MILKFFRTMVPSFRLLLTKFSPIICIFTVLLLFILKDGHCAVKTAIVTGNWDDISTWSGATPDCGDTLIIPAGETVTVTTQSNYSNCGSQMVIYVHGTLAFQSGKKLQFPCNSYVGVRIGGKIEADNGGGNSNYIDICGITQWSSANGNISTPVCMPSGAPLCPAVLPITLVNFSADWNNMQLVSIQWATAAEINNNYFELLRSEDAGHYETIGRINGHGNSTALNTYSFTDENATTTSGKYIYYRLKQVDYDGKISYYGPVAIKSLTEKKKFMVAENPIRKSDPLKIIVNRKGYSTLHIVDDFGRTVFTKEVISTEPYKKLNIDLPTLSSGLYSVIFQSGETADVQKIIIAGY